MKRTNFNQDMIFGGVKSQHLQDSMWSDFINVVGELNCIIHVTGGAFLTHEINCSEDDLYIIIDLAKN